MSSTQPATGVLARIASHPPRRYAIAYAILIPLFAMGYWLVMPDHFYVETADLEPRIQQAPAALDRDLYSYFYANLSDQARAAGDPCLYGIEGGSVLSLCGATYFSDPLVVDESEAKFTFPVGWTEGVDGGTASGAFWLRISLDLNSWHLDSSVDRNMVIAAHIEVENGSSRQIPRSLVMALFPGTNPSLIWDADLGRAEESNEFNSWVVIDDAMVRRLVALRDALDGVPGRDFQGLVRMTYLSIVTSTTLGFGDIVPVTDLGRMVVGTEAVLGLILIGLFVNSSFAGVRVSSPEP